MIILDEELFAIDDRQMNLQWQIELPYYICTLISNERLCVR